MAKKSFRGTFAYKTDVGKVRIVNEDQVTVAINHGGDVLLCVCDGLGGQNKGDYASKVAIDTMKEAFQTMNPKMPLLFKKWWLRKTMKQANSSIFDDSQSKPELHDMGTTCVCVLISGRRMIVANVGDSRAYKCTDSGIVEVTSDQTYVNYLYRTGKISESQTKTHPDRHVLMNAVGIFPSLSLDISIMPYNGEGILLCSDGLYNNLQEREIAAIVRTDDRVDRKVNSLINEANHNGGSDNIAVAYWETIHD